MADSGAVEYQEQKESVGQFEIHIVSFRLGDRYNCKVDNVNPGAVISRAEGGTREEAENAAVAIAREEIGKTRVMREP